VLLALVASRRAELTMNTSASTPSRTVPPGAGAHNDVPEQVLGDLRAAMSRRSRAHCASH